MSKVLNYILDCLFPKYCLGCGKEYTYLCARCMNRIPRAGVQCCPVCTEENSDGRVHARCNSESALQGVIAASYYHNPLVRSLIHTLKYRSIADLASPLAHLTAEAFLRAYPWRDIARDVVVIPVPLHAKRLRTRGFNQSERIAAHMTCRVGLKVDASSLVRVRHTVPQAQLDETLRHGNVANTFLWHGESLQGKHVVLIDDVYTTGATLEACAEALRAASPLDIWGVVIAK